MSSSIERASAVSVLAAMLAVGVLAFETRGLNMARADEAVLVAGPGAAGSSETPALSVVGVPEDDQASSTDSLPTISEYLSRFSVSQQANARISVHLGSSATAETEAAALAVVELWNSGSPDRATHAITSLEESGVAVAIGIAWDTPVPLGTGSGFIDVRLGGTRIGASQVVLGRWINLEDHAAIRWSAAGSDPGWSLNVSEDHGATWSETYYWYAPTHGVRDIDMLSYTSVPEVAYIWDGNPYSVHSYGGHGPYTKFSESPFAKTDVAIDTSWQSAGTPGALPDDPPWFVVTAAIQEGGELLLFVSYVRSFQELSPSETTIYSTSQFSPEAGLDLCVGWYEKRVTDPYGGDMLHIYASYVGSGQVHVWHVAHPGPDKVGGPRTNEVTTLGPFIGTHPHTTLMCSKYWYNPNRRLICLYEEDFTDMQGIRSHFSEDGGETWSSQVLVGPPALLELGEVSSSEVIEVLSPELVEDQSLELFEEPSLGAVDEFWPELINTEGNYYMPFMPSHDAHVVFAEAAGKPNIWFSSFSWNVLRWSPPVTLRNNQRCYHHTPLAIENITWASSGESYNLGLAYINRTVVDNESDSGAYAQQVPYFSRAPGPGGYCHVNGAFGESPSISYVAIGAIADHANASTYLDRWYISTQLARGRSYEMEVRASIGNPEGFEQCVVWIDWNQDLDFDDADEMIPAPYWPILNRWWITITVPLHATLGKTRMRIRTAMSSEATLEPCDGAETGAVVDYTVDIVDYCAASSGCGQYISRVQCNDIDNATDCDGYASYRDLATDMSIGESYPTTVTVGNGYAGNVGGLWVDWNRDLDFRDNGEQLAFTPSSGAGPYTATVIPPPDATPGLTCMRVRLHREVDEFEPCLDEAFGEVEDYWVNIIDPAYCGAQGQCTPHTPHIARVQFGDISNMSGCTSGYSDYTKIETIMNIGATYDLTITAGDTNSPYACSVLIDWNQDGVFDSNDPEEAITVIGSPGIGPYTALVTAGFDALPGETRMRIRLDQTSPLGPCDESAQGEVEDYTIVVLGEPYCVGHGGCGDHIFISRVQLDSIDNTSDCSPLGYANHEDLTARIYRGSTYDLTVTPGQAVSNAPYDGCTAWADWNHDFDFDDADETIYFSGSPGPGPYTATVTTPPNAVDGETRIRIRVDHTSPLGPCDTAAVGEVEDYTLVVSDAPAPPPDGCGAGSAASLAGAAVFGSLLFLRRRSV